MIAAVVLVFIFVSTSTWSQCDNSDTKIQTWLPPSLDDESFVSGFFNIIIMVLVLMLVVPDEHVDADIQNRTIANEWIKHVIEVGLGLVWVSSLADERQGGETTFLSVSFRRKAGKRDAICV